MKANQELQDFLEKHRACSEGKTWALESCETLQEVWNTAKPEWLLWVATRPNVLSEQELRLFACWCCRQIWHLLTDARSRGAVTVAEKFANGEATEYELRAARDAARDAAGAAAWAAWDAAWGGAGDAAGAAAWAAAWDAAGAAAGAAAWDGAARAAAWDAAGAAAGAAAWAAAWDAAGAARAARARARAGAAAGAAQVDYLRNTYSPFLSETKSADRHEVREDA